MTPGADEPDVGDELDLNCPLGRIDKVLIIPSESAPRSAHIVVIEVRTEKSGLIFVSA